MFKTELQIPRYARVNTLKTTTDEVITWFSKNGFKLQSKKNETLNLSQVRQCIFVGNAGICVYVSVPNYQMRAFFFFYYLLV